MDFLSTFGNMNSFPQTIFNAQEQKFPVVGIGTSGDCIDSIISFVENIPADSGMAFLLFHFDTSKTTAELKDALAVKSGIGIKIMDSDAVLEPNFISIISENQFIFSENDKLYLNNTEPSENKFSLDDFFSSLANGCKDSAQGILFSKNGLDGNLGLKHIKEHGGMTFSQAEVTDEKSTNMADFNMTPADIPSQLMHLKSFYAPSPAADIKMLHTDDEVYKIIIDLLKQKTGNDFSHYKQPTIRRRIARRMVIAKIETSEEYLNFLKSDAKELVYLFNDILIPVSYFFRDSKVFQMLPEMVFPKIFEKKNENDTIRIWVAGCSTGEEAYSIAIALHEYLKERKSAMKVQIFASDISENVIAKARTGCYLPQDVRNISVEKLKKYFTKVDGLYQINKEIRDLCVFAKHNFTKDPPFAKLDMISCRNVLIYLNTYLQKKAFTTFHYALLPSGILFLGKSESTNHAPGLFKPLVKNHTLFGKHNSIHSKPSILRETPQNRNQIMQEKATKKELSIPDFQKNAENILFNSYTPAGVIVNENKDIIHFHGNTGEFLIPPQGKPNFNILKMVREGLAFEVRSAILDAKTTQTKCIKTAIPIKGKDYFADIEVIPLHDKSEEHHYLVLFQKSYKLIGETKAPDDEETADRKRILLLESEIEQLREDIRRVTEDQEVANEELQSANEELLSNSEELQTLNEELETSAEQLQSNNEELLMANEELTNRQEQLIAARLYAETIIESIREPLVIVDAEMRVRGANASFYNHFGASQNEVESKNLFDTFLASGNLRDFQSQIENALSENTNLDNVEVKMLTNNFIERVMIMNVRPVNSTNIGEPLALLAIEDITEILTTNKMLATINKDLEENNKHLAAFSSVASHDLQEPLRKISLFSSMIVESESEVISEEASGYLTRIISSTRRLQRLIDDLLLYSKVSSLKRADFRETNLKQLIQDAGDDLDNVISDKNGQIIVGDVPPLKIISPLVRQVFSNLISNALKYSREDETPKIRISAQQVKASDDETFEFEKDRDYMRISIEDNGIGFDPKNASHLFEPFFRLHSKEIYEGSGIGLAICKKIMNLHSGYINCTSTEGKGSIFYLYFPIFT